MKLHYFKLKVKNINSPSYIEEKVLYDINIFYTDKYPIQSYPNIINYRCINYRKEEMIRTSQFCNALLKRKTINKAIYYILEKDHSKECVELNTKQVKIETNLIGKYNEYNDFINKCFKIFRQYRRI